MSDSLSYCGDRYQATCPHASSENHSTCGPSREIREPFHMFCTRSSLISPAALCRQLQPRQKRMTARSTNVKQSISAKKIQTELSTSPGGQVLCPLSQRFFLAAHANSFPIQIRPSQVTGRIPGPVNSKQETVNSQQFCDRKMKPVQAEAFHWHSATR